MITLTENEIIEKLNELNVKLNLPLEKWQDEVRTQSGVFSTHIKFKMCVHREEFEKYADKQLITLLVSRFQDYVRELKHRLEELDGN